MRAYKDLKPCARDLKAGEQPSSLEICPGHSLSVVEGLVCVDGKATTEFFEQAEEVEDCNVSYFEPSQFMFTRRSASPVFIRSVLLCSPQVSLDSVCRLKLAEVGQACSAACILEMRSCFQACRMSAVCCY